jgi:DNA primase large subunit
VEPSLLTRYPFLPEARSLVEEDGPTLGRLMEGHAYDRARSRGRERVTAALEREEGPEPTASSEAEALIEVLGYVVARLLVSCIDDSLLTNRFALMEAERVASDLREDADDRFVAVCDALGIPLAPTDPGREEDWRVPFDAYLGASRRLSALEWKLVNRTMDEGHVLLTRDEGARLAQEALRLQLLDELPLELPSDVREALQTMVDPLEARLAEVRAGREEVDIDQVEPEAFPPCMNALISSIHAGENVSHEGRFAIVAFLNRAGMDKGTIINELFPHVPDFAMDVTEYQVDHITSGDDGDGYTPPGCSSMQTYGICPMMAKAEDDWDDWCAHEKMNHPLTYYRWGLYVEEQREDEETPDADEAAPEGEGEAASDDEGGMLDSEPDVG